jgi:DNA-binding XRE family transcriptional regulator
MTKIYSIGTMGRKQCAQRFDGVWFERVLTAGKHRNRWNRWHNVGTKRPENAWYDPANGEAKLPDPVHDDEEPKPDKQQTIPQSDTIGSRFLAARLKSGYTQDGLAQTLKVNATTIRSMERNRGVGLYVFIEACRLLNVSLDYIVYGTPHNQR